MSKDGYWYIHPRQNRTLSIREAARVQSFPDGFEFYGYPSNRFHQIGEAVAPIVALKLGKALIKSISDKKNISKEDKVPRLRKNLIHWYESNKKEVELIWTKKRDGRKIIPQNIRAWNSFLGILIPENFIKNNKERKLNAKAGDKLIENRKKDSYLIFKNFWPSAEDFLSDRFRIQKLKSQRLEKFNSSIELLAEELIKDEINWNELIRRDYELFSRNAVRGALATVGLTTEIKQSVAITKIISRLMNIDYEYLKFSNMNREIHIGHLLEMDREGTGYCSLIALSKHEQKEKFINSFLENIPKQEVNNAA